MGLFVSPNIPPRKLRNAVRDYASSVEATEVLALYDATLLGSAKDGALFMADRFVFQNNDLEAPQEVSYADLVEVVSERKRLGGRKVSLVVNRGRATLNLTIDFSGRKEAAPFVERFLYEAMQHGAAQEMAARRTESFTDWSAVREAMTTLQHTGKLQANDAARLHQFIDELASK